MRFWPFLPSLSAKSRARHTQRLKLDDCFVNSLNLPSKGQGLDVSIQPAPQSHRCAVSKHSAVNIRTETFAAHTTPSQTSCPFHRSRPPNSLTQHSRVTVNRMTHEMFGQPLTPDLVVVRFVCSLCLAFCADGPSHAHTHARAYANVNARVCHGVTS